jgi:hypothetical protein
MIDSEYGQVSPDNLRAGENQSFKPAPTVRAGFSNNLQNNKINRLNLPLLLLQISISSLSP